MFQFGLEVPAFLEEQWMCNARECETEGSKSIAPQSDHVKHRQQQRGNCMFLCSS